LDLENKLKENERNEKGYKTMWAMINRKYNELEQQYYALKRQQVKKN
jgi:oligoendopeptidase F